MRRASIVALPALFALSLATRSAIADPPAASADPPLRLERRIIKPDFEWTYPRFGVAEGVATLVLGAATIAGAVLPPSSNPWRSATSFDESARDALRASSLAGRDGARDASDILLAVNLSAPLLMDSLAAAYWRHKSPDVAFQMAAIDTEAFALTGALSSLTSGLSSRERPYGRLCPADPALQNRDCATNQRYKAFFSGHSSTSFTAATLVCSHHAHYPLFGGGAPDVMACIVALASAGTTATLRVVADQHYITDVLMGSAVGALSGLAVPWLFHYRSPLTMTAGTATVTLVPSPTGAYVMGLF
jgi:membrane-associated phospholipid phosphatase